MSTNITDLANETHLKKIYHFTYFLFYKTLQSFSHKKKTPFELRNNCTLNPSNATDIYKPGLAAARPKKSRQAKKTNFR